MTPGYLARLGLIALLAQTAAPAALSETGLLGAGLRPGWRAENGTQIAGIEFLLSRGWKTYWRAPGDAGIPPDFDWSGSENVASARIRWPQPEVFEQNGMRAIGYSGHVVLPVEVTPRDPSRPVRLRAEVSMGVCKDICVPASVMIEAVLPSPGAADPVIRAALDNRPATAREAGLSALSCRVEPIRDGLRVTATMQLPATRSLGVETVVLEPGQPGVWVSEAVVTREGRQLTATAEMVAPSGAPFALDRGRMVVTVLAGGRAVEARGCPGG